MIQRGSMPAEQACRLPGGVLVEGQWTRIAAVRQLTGRDEEWLSEWPRTVPTAVVQSALLERCVTRIGRARPTADLIGGMLVGDRDYLLLWLRRVCLGSRFEATAECPACASRIDLSFDFDDIPVEERPQQEASFTAELGRADGSTAMVRYHLPRGLDQERAAEAGGRGAAELLACCVEGVDGVSDPDRMAPLLDEAVERQLEQRMEAQAPQVTADMDIVCPECGRASSHDFELAPFLLDELGSGAQHILREVHTLAFNYHWTEAEILDMPSSRRHAYLGLLQREMTGTAD